MKKIFLILFILSIFFQNPANAAFEDGRTQQNGFVRECIVLGRGVTNLVTSPLELLATPLREPGIHRWLWPMTSVPRGITNVIVRLSSGVNDLLVHPFVVPFTNDISPITEPYDLPEYVWQKR